MDNSTYLSASEVTERKFPDGLAIPAREFHDLAGLFASFVDIAKQIDKLKKALIYKDIPTDGRPVVKLEQQSVEFLHAIMGMTTEVAELVEALGPDIVVKDLTHFLEELGDVRWYEAIFLRHLGASAEQVQAANIAKLSARYPDKFSGFAALNRDLDAERTALEEHF